jgi:hypothetical protein
MFCSLLPPRSEIPAKIREKITAGKEIGAGIFKLSMGARNRAGIGLSYRPARLHRLAEFIPWNRFLGSIKVQKYGLRTRDLFKNAYVHPYPFCQST